MVNVNVENLPKPNFPTCRQRGMDPHSTIFFCGASHVVFPCCEWRQSRGKKGILQTQRKLLGPPPRGRVWPRGPVQPLCDPISGKPQQPRQSGEKDPAPDGTVLANRHSPIAQQRLEMGQPMAWLALELERLLPSPHSSRRNLYFAAVGIS